MIIEIRSNNQRFLGCHYDQRPLEYWEFSLIINTCTNFPKFIVLFRQDFALTYSRILTCGGHTATVLCTCTNVMNHEEVLHSRFLSKHYMKLNVNLYLIAFCFKGNAKVMALEICQSLKDTNFISLVPQGKIEISFSSINLQSAISLPGLWTEV